LAKYIITFVFLFVSIPAYADPFHDFGQEVKEFFIDIFGKNHKVRVEQPENDDINNQNPEFPPKNYVPPTTRDPIFDRPNTPDPIRPTYPESDFPGGPKVDIEIPFEGAPVPEPSTIALIAIGSAVAYRMRKNAKRS